MLRHKTSWATATKGILVFPLLPDGFASAEQGVAHAQWRLGLMLLDGRKTFGESSVAVPKGTDEGVKWLLSQQNPGSGGCSFIWVTVRKGQRGEARLHGGLQVVIGSPQRRMGCWELVKLDPLILKMSQEQISKGKDGVKGFHPSPDSKGRTARPAIRSGHRGSRVLRGSRSTLCSDQQSNSGAKEKREKSRPENCHCEVPGIKEKSVAIQIEGIEQPQEIGLK